MRQERGTWVAILIQHVILKKESASNEQLKTIDSEENFE